MDYTRDDDDVTGVRDSKERRTPDVAIAQQIGRDRCSYHPDDNTPPSRRTKDDQNPGSHSRSGPEYGNTIGRLQQCKAQPRGEKIGQCHSDGQNDFCPAYERVASQNDRLFCGSAQCPLQSSGLAALATIGPLFRSSHYVAVH